MTTTRVHRPHHLQWLWPATLFAALLIGLFCCDLMISREGYLRRMQPLILHYGKTTDTLIKRLSQYAAQRQQEPWPDAFIPPIELREITSALEHLQQQLPDLPPRWWKEHKALHFALSEACYQLNRVTADLESSIAQSRHAVQTEANPEVSDDLPTGSQLTAITHALSTTVADEQSDIDLSQTWRRAIATHQSLLLLIRHLYGKPLASLIRE